MKRFADLSEQELLALAISSEEEDSCIYRSCAEGLRGQYPLSAAMFDRMAEEEVKHHTWLSGLYHKKFGDFVPLIRRQDVKMLWGERRGFGTFGALQRTDGAPHAANL